MDHCEVPIQFNAFCLLSRIGFGLDRKLTCPRHAILLVRPGLHFVLYFDLSPGLSHGCPGQFVISKTRLLAPRIPDPG
jgi:hypothetical protein